MRSVCFLVGTVVWLLAAFVKQSLCIPPEVEMIQADWMGVSDNAFEYVNSNGRFESARHIHNETKVTIAKKIALDHSDIKTGLSRRRYPNSDAGDNACIPRLSTDLSHSPKDPRFPNDLLEIDVIAIESCSHRLAVYFLNEYLKVSSDFRQDCCRSEPIMPDDKRFPRHTVKLFVNIKVESLSILAEGVYQPATGKMHTLGCIRKLREEGFLSRNFAWNRYEENSTVPPELESVENSTYLFRRLQHWRVFDQQLEAGLKSLLNDTLEVDCDISATIQYPPVDALWNTERRLKLKVQSNRKASDPLFFQPLERTSFFAYEKRGSVEFQRRLETGGRFVFLILGLFCIAQQINYGRHNKECLPFVSLAMLSLQIAKHLSQTSVISDFKIGYGINHHGFQYDLLTSYGRYSASYNDYIFENGVRTYYYNLRALTEYVPYQATAMAAIFMYIFLFHKVGDARKIMDLKMRRKRPGAEHAPSEWPVMYKTVAIFFMIIFVGFFSQHPVYYYRFLNRGMTFIPQELYYEFWESVNSLTGLIISFFLIPQVIGNWHWDVQGRPLSTWFYGGISFLQSVPRIFSLLKHFEVMPILSFYDPYLDSVYGSYDAPPLVWDSVVVSCTLLLALIVHFQRECGRSTSKLTGISRGPDQQDWV